METMEEFLKESMEALIIEYAIYQDEFLKNCVGISKINHGKFSQGTLAAISGELSKGISEKCFEKSPIGKAIETLRRVYEANIWKIF